MSSLSGLAIIPPSFPILHSKASPTFSLEQRQPLDGLWKEHGLVFTTQIGTAINRYNLITRSFKPLLARTGLPEIRFHDLRHTLATLMLGGRPTRRWCKNS